MTEDEAYIRMMFGDKAVKCGFNYIIQTAGDGKVQMVAQSTCPVGSDHPLRFGSSRTHVMGLGDMVFRPHLVMASDGLRGRGVSSIAKDGFLDMDVWGPAADVVIDAHGKIAELQRRSR